MLNIRGIVCDVEGTLVDLEREHHEAYLAAARSVGLPYNTVLEGIQNIPGFIGGPDEKVARSVCDLSGQTGKYNQALGVILETYHRLFELAEIKIRPGFLEFLWKAQQLGLSVCLQTGTPPKYAKPILERSGLARLFPRHLIVLPPDVRSGKPSPDSFLESAERMRIKPTEQLVFGDSTRDTLAAKAANSTAIGMPVYYFEEAWRPLVETGATEVFLRWEDVGLEELLQTLES